VGLRTTLGVDLAELRSWAGAEVQRLELLFDGWRTRGLVWLDGDHLRPTDAGLLVADALAADVVDILL
jgi:coproporphyrinogen III oxidase-like Fe-S oxidoreductase